MTIKAECQSDLVLTRTLTLNTEFPRGGDVLGGNHERVRGSVVSGDVLYQQLVDLLVDHDVDAVGGRYGLTVLHPGSLDVLLGEPDLQLGDVPLADREVGQGLHQGHRAHWRSRNNITPKSH